MAAPDFGGRTVASILPFFVGYDSLPFLAGRPITLSMYGTLMMPLFCFEGKLHVFLLKLSQIQNLVLVWSEDFFDLQTGQSFPIVGVAHGGYYVS
jgi:hypothetical protein